jgi:hypothetical protein
MPRVSDRAALPLTFPALGRELPAHCPYKVGDWVRVHGWHNAFPPGLNSWGWRGFITGCIGGTILVGLTDDGREWAENWGILEPDKPRPRGVFDVCVCCPRAPLPPPAGRQATLFDLPAPVLRNGDVWWWREQYSFIVGRRG